MDLFRSLVANVTLPFFEWRDGRVFDPYFLEYMESQYLSSDDIRCQQTRKLSELIEFCYASNGYYREKMEDLGIVPSDVRSIEQLQSFPILEKKTIRELGEGLFSTGYGKENSVHMRTGGSTGVPLHVYVDREAMDRKQAAAWRHNSWAGWRRGDKVAAVWGDTSAPKSIRKRIRAGLTNRTIYLDTLRFSEEKLSDFCRRMRSYAPRILMGHSHSVYQLASYCLDQGKEFSSIKAVVTTAMTLVEHERDIIEQAFDCRVFNRYGCEELSIIASESGEYDGLSVFSEGLIIEFEETGVDGLSELIITDLLNHAMPLIRYRIGDLGVPSSPDKNNACGLSRLESVRGRTADFLFRVDGTPIFGISLLDTFVIHISGIHQLQLVQNKVDLIHVNLVPDMNYTEQTDRDIRKVICKEFGSDMQCSISTVQELEKTSAGKYRFSICNLT